MEDISRLSQLLNKETTKDSFLIAGKTLKYSKCQKNFVIKSIFENSFKTKLKKKYIKHEVGIESLDFFVIS
jgi:hypothetical protein